MRRLLRDRNLMAIAAPAAAAGALAIVLPHVPTLVVLAIVILTVTFAAVPMLGWSLAVLAYPFIYLQAFIGETVNVPYVDLLALLTAVGIALRALIRWWRHRERPPVGRLPGILPFLAFIAVAALSLMHAEDVGAGAKFLLRPLMFFYLMYVALPAIIVDSPRRLFTTLRLMFLVGGLVAAMGVWSLLVPSDPGAFRRAVPIAIFGMTPLGTNHNLIAEVLVSVVPIGIILALFSQDSTRRWYAVGTCALGLVTLLTFSRNGWLTLAVEGVVLLVALARERGVRWRRILIVAAPIVTFATLAIGIFSTTTVAQSSNVNRLRLTAIALAQFREHPIIGGGVGTFIETVRRDRWYVADFGQPQEAHGLVQKLLAETGLLGLVAFVALLGAIVRYVVRMYQRSVAVPAWRLILLSLLLSTAGSIVFQLFNTSYFVSKLWLPLGVAVAAARLAERGIALREGDALAVQGQR